jgi:hypothetical protein
VGRETWLPLGFIPLYSYLMANLTYGTPDYYAELFGDILADVDYENPEYAENIVKGFLLAVNSFLDYHDKQTRAYDELGERVRKALSV